MYIICHSSLLQYIHSTLFATKKTLKLKQAYSERVHYPMTVDSPVRSHSSHEAHCDSMQ